MSNKLAELIVRTLEENPGASVIFHRRETRPAGDVVVVEVQGNGPWAVCPTRTNAAETQLWEALEDCRALRADGRPAAAAPKPDYVPTEAGEVNPLVLEWSRLRKMKAPGRFCVVCGGEQRHCRSGWVCEQGHGGADWTIGPPESGDEGATDTDATR